MEARQIICPLLIRFAPGINNSNACQCPWCGGKVYPEYKVEKCELCGMPYTTEYRS